MAVSVAGTLAVSGRARRGVREAAGALVVGGERASVFRGAIESSSAYGPVESFGAYRLYGDEHVTGTRLLVEPLRETTLKFTCDGCSKHSSARVEWRLLRTTEDGESLEGDPLLFEQEGLLYSFEAVSAVEAVVAVARPGMYRAQAHLVSQSDSQSEAASSPASGSVDESLVLAWASAAVHCLYVRREVRELLPNDLARYFAALQQLATLPGAEGRREYGASFHSVPELTKVHLLRGASRVSDELHDGVGFLAQHLALSNEFETALQAVDASVALPFWDFTRDYVAFQQTGEAGGLQQLLAANPALWTDAAFGETTETTTFVRVPHATTTPEAFQKPQRETDAKADETASSSSSQEETWASAGNAYGYMRSPWNLNGEPFVTRFGAFCGVERPVTDWPRCADHHSLTFAATPLHAYMRAAGGHPHGSVHMMLGGADGCGESLGKLRTTVAKSDALRAEQVRARANATDQRVAASFGDASESESESESSSESPPSKSALAAAKKNKGSSPEAASSFAAVDDFLVHVKDALQALWRLHLLELPSACSADAPAEACHALCAGDSQEAWAQTLWEDELVLAYAPQLSAFESRAERAALAEALCETPWAFGEHAGAESPLDASFWPMHPTLDRLLQYKRLVADFRDANWTSATTNVCKYSAISPCQGHNEHDLTSFQTPLLQDDGDYKPRYLTNREMVDFTDPRDYRMTYIYSSFSWPHCDDQTDFNFPAVPTTPTVSPSAMSSLQTL